MDEYQTIGQLPSAEPITSSDLMVVEQGGEAKKVPASAFRGAAGISFTPEIGTVSTRAPGSDATVSVQTVASQAKAVFSFGIPRGATGEAGITYTPEIGEVTTLPSGSDATVSIQVIASQAKAIFNFGIPRG